MAIPALALVVLAAASMTLLTMADSSLKQDRATKQSIATDLVADAGLSAAFFDLTSGGTGNLGSEQAPIAYDGASYFVQCANDGTGVYTFRSEAQSGKVRRRLELVLAKSNGALGRWGAFGESSLAVSGQVLLDSYDSSAGSYASQLGAAGVNGAAQHNGDIGSNQGLMLSDDATIFGKAVPGPGSSVSLTGNASVSGSTNPAQKPVKLPPISVPSFPDQGPLVASNMVLGSGSYHYSSLQIASGSTLTIAGPAQVVLGACALEAGAQLIVDPSAGPVEVFLLGSLTMDSGSQMFPSTMNPSDFVFSIVGDNLADPSIVFDFDAAGPTSDTKIWGSVYAPNAHLQIDSNFELFGSMVSKELNLGGTAKLHFDEALMNQAASPSDNWTRLAWRRLP